MRAHVLTDRLFDGTVDLGGTRAALTPPAATRRYRWESSHRQWEEVYDRDRVAQLRAAR